MNEEQYKKVLALMELGKKEGATLKCGGEKMAGENGGYFVQQTVFADVTDDMTIAKEEVSCFSFTTQKFVIRPFSFVMFVFALFLLCTKFK